ncbi:protein DPCD-like isoform X1 [Strongylocentrotus purpuratus]|uniref:Protein DPCD n=1 Tax=Strongylocentrotus purpuratus TaxID=7668 RepID=A0A7M7PCS4_STRPU|nr:protein DPCD-like isoform X1 [Strongylocentrotus purpuratus]
MASSMAWLETLRKSRKTALIQDGRRKLHFILLDGRELVEEYDVKTNDLLVRKWKSKNVLGREVKWEFEIGEQFRRPAAGGEADLLMESSSNPIFTRKDTRQAFQWRIRNLPYPIETYSLSVDQDTRCCIIRTSNKKYYKKFSIPDMDRAGLPLQQSDFSMAHSNNTLIINYKKPAEILALEKQVIAEIQKTKESKEGDMECAPS